MNYFKSEQIPEVDDIIATCRHGQCRILEITPEAMLRVENIYTNEEFFEYPDECDYLGKTVMEAIG